ncbi:MAG: Ig-like domain-containing protein [Prevotellaceae bacterium]|nr:Ig-like domain-containing protein [Prevotellaceae bacterium]
MKTQKFFTMLLAAMTAITFASCGSDEPNNGGGGGTDEVKVTLDQHSLELKVGESVKLVATVEPAGTVTWSSSNNDVVIATNGTVIAKAVGTAVVFATSGTGKDECTVTVTEGGSTSVDFSKFACLQGNNYFPIALSQGALDYLAGKGKTVTWIGPNGPGTDVDGNGKIDNAQNMWYWENSVGAGTPEGQNSFGELDGYFCIYRNLADWGGAGFAIGAPETYDNVTPINMSDIYAHPEQYFFHLALKTTDPSFTVTLGFGDGVQNNKKEVKFSFGDVPGDLSQAPRAAIPKDGMWHEFEIPCTEFVKGDQVMYQNPFYDANIMFMLLFPSQGVTLHLDAAFFYKK